MSSNNNVGHNICFTLDVLTDGSEYTGHGTLFLSVWRTPTPSIIVPHRPTTHEDEDCRKSYQKEEDDDDDDDDSDPSVSSSHYPTNNVIDTEYMATTPPLARYAITGAGDAIARLCADQRFKLASTRAVFMPQCSRESQSADGLSALFLALYSAGAPFLHVVAPSSDPTEYSVSTEQSDSVSNHHHHHHHHRYPPHDERFRSKDDDWIEELALITLGRHKQFDIRTCRVQKGTDRASDRINWWKVFEDEYLVVHAGYSPETAIPPWAQTSSSLIYLYSFGLLSSSRKNCHQYPLSCQESTTTKFSTMAVLPPNCKNIITTISILKQQCCLPMILNDIPISVDYIIALNPPSSCDNHYHFDRATGSPSGDSSTMNGEVADDWFVMYTSPKNHTLDEGLLMRSQQVAHYFHQHMPWAFGTAAATTKTTNETSKEGDFLEPVSNPISSTILSTKDPIRLVSGTSIVLLLGETPKIATASTISKTQYCPSSLLVLDRRTVILDRPVRDEWASTLESLRSFIPDPSHTLSDDNEIDLDDDDDDDDDGDDHGHDDSSHFCQLKTLDRNPQQHPLRYQDGLPRSSSSSSCSCHLLVLGTGCATPSAYRGASGYALVMSSPKNVITSSRDSHNNNNSGGGSIVSNSLQMKKDEIFLLDCGEGTTTMLSRSVRGSDLHNDDDWMGQIRGIWISHAHLDHFGGLPTLIRTLYDRQHNKRKKDGGSMVDPPSKRPKYHDRTQRASQYETEQGNAPWIIAPPKVLRYLDVVLHCRHGLPIDGGTGHPKVRYFWPRLHFDPTPPNGPWIHFEPITVDHNCCPSYGLLVGWAGYRRENNTMGKPIKSFLCYSGDTRPCRAIVQACQRVLLPSHPTSSSVPLSSPGMNDLRSSGASLSSSSSLSPPPPPPPTTTTTTTDTLFLIHEATFADTDRENAIQRKHSTISEAMDIATTIPAGKVLLSHFSQRYISLDGNTIIGSTHNRTDKDDDDENVQHLPSVGIGGGVPMGLATDGLWIPLE